MTDLGDEFILESYRVPWLIWIQLLIMILLIILLFFGFSVFTLDLEPSTLSSDAAPPPPPPPPAPISNPSSSHGRAKAETQRSRGDRVLSNTELAREEVQIEGASPSKESPFIRIFRNPNHPCNFFGQAKRAVLKCLGLDSSSEVSSSDHHEKQE